MNAPKCTAQDSIDFLVASPRAVSGTEAARVQPPRADPPAHDAFTRLLHRLEPNPAALWEEAAPLVARGASWSWTTGRSRRRRSKGVHERRTDESTLDYYAQHRDGTVYYLGEDVDMYQDGKVVSHRGAWRAGEGGIRPGVFMPAEPAVGQTFEQERAPGVAEDRSTVVAVDQQIAIRAGHFGGCIRTEDVDPLGGASEHKHYCPGVGLAREEFAGGFLDLG